MKESTKPKVRWGVIGCGGIAARRTIPEFVRMASNAQIDSVMDVDPARAAEVAARFKVPHHCTSEAELLARDIDAVYVATPQDCHCRQVAQAAEAGKHILCEKPMAISLGEVEQMEAACRKAGVKFMLGFCMRYNVYNRKVREIVQGGGIGRNGHGARPTDLLVPADQRRLAAGRREEPRGALIDMGTHCLDLLEWISGSTITEVTGFHDLLTHAYPTRIEDTSTVLLRFSNGAHGIVDNYFNVPDVAAQNTLEIYGTKGAIIAHGTIGQDPTGTMFSILQPQETGYAANQLRDGEVARQEYRLEGIGLYGQMIEALSRCIIEDTAPPIGVKDGRHSVAVTLAAYQAARERRVVSVNESVTASVTA